MSARVKLLRAICIRGDRHEIGETVELDDATAGMLISLGRAECADRATKQRLRPVPFSGLLGAEKPHAVPSSPNFATSWGIGRREK